MISHEALSSRPYCGQYYAPVVAERLHRVFPSGRVVIGVREQRSMVLSLFRQHIRTGGRECLRQFIGTGDEPEGWAPICSMDFLRYDRPIGFYTGLFGTDRVLVLPIELLTLDRLEYQRRLAAFAGVPDFDSPALAERSNAGWGGVTLQFQRRMNRVLLRNRLGPDQPWLVRKTTRACYKINRIMPASWDDRIEQRWKTTIAARVGRMFTESNERLAAATGYDLRSFGYDMPD